MLGARRYGAGPLHLVGILCLPGSQRKFGELTWHVWMPEEGWTRLVSLPLVLPASPCV